MKSKIFDLPFMFKREEETITQLAKLSGYYKLKSLGFVHTWPVILSFIKKKVVVCYKFYLLVMFFLSQVGVMCSVDISKFFIKLAGGELECIIKILPILLISLLIVLVSESNSIAIVIEYTKVLKGDDISSFLE